MPDAEREDRPGEDGSDRAFRIFFRGFLLLCLVPCTIVIFDSKAPDSHRVIAGVLWPALAFMFYAIGRPAIGRLYTLAIAVFCLLLGGFATIGCLLDAACVPLERGLVAMVATAIMVASRWLDLRLARGTVRQLVTRCVTIASVTTAFYLVYHYRALGGGLMFLVFAVFAFAAALQSKSDIQEPEPPKPARVEPHSPIVLAAGSAAYWLAGYSRSPMGAWLIVGFGAAWLFYTVYRFRQSRKDVNSIQA